MADNDPICPTCKTDDYLDFSDFTPGHNETRSFGSWGADRIIRTSWVSPVVHYTCMKCGHRNGHSVPDDWTMPVPNPRMKPDRSYFMRADGTIVI